MKRRNALKATATFAALGITLAMGGCGSDNSIHQSGRLDNSLFGSVTRLTQSGSFDTPRSAVPDASGQFVYFVANGPNGAGVFKVPASGGAAVEVKTGPPFVAPFDITISSDNQTLFVADPQAGGAGQIFTLPVTGAAPTPLPGTDGTAPRALEVIRQGGSDQVYFSGKDPTGGEPAVFKIPATGSAGRTVVARGAPLIEPSGVAITRTGVVYVVDRGSQTTPGRVFRVDGAALTRVADNLHTGNPAGAVLTPDDAVLAVSTLDPSSGTAQLFLLNLSTLTTGVFNQVIGANRNAGGLHAARNANGNTGANAWANATNDGAVYQVPIHTLK